jgi:CBS domain-containing protein
MCAQYLESFVDSIIVRNDAFEPAGMVGGYELLDNLRKSPTRDFQYSTTVGDIMLKQLTQVDKTTTLSELVKVWQESGRAFSIILNEFGDCSTISARRLIDLGARCNTDVSISSIHRNKAVTFSKGATLGEVLDLMYKNRVRKLLLQDSHEFINDRLILGEISKILRFQTDVDYFLDLPMSEFKLAQSMQVTEDLKFNEACSLMQSMEHPTILYEDSIITPWDICLGLMSDGVTWDDLGSKSLDKYAETEIPLNS